MFETQQHGEEDAARKECRGISCEYEREEENAVKEAVVLEVDVVDN